MIRPNMLFVFVSQNNAVCRSFLHLPNAIVTIMCSNDELSSTINWTINSLKIWRFRHESKFGRENGTKFDLVKLTEGYLFLYFHSIKMVAHFQQFQ